VRRLASLRGVSVERRPNCRLPAAGMLFALGQQHADDANNLGDNAAALQDAVDMIRE